VEHDHPDLFPTAEAFEEAFRDFADRLQPDGTLIACLDDKGSARLLNYANSQGKQTVSYAHSHSEANYLAQDLHPEPKGFSFTITKAGKKLAKLSLQVPGQHNVQNALGALVVADLLGLSLDEASMALADFRGTGRRFEERGEAWKVVVIDDYAHHPTEVSSTLAAARSRYPGRRILAVWQPHTYSRTVTLLDDFGTAFTAADQVLVTDVYPARESQPPDFDMELVVSSIKHPGVHYTPSLSDARNLLLQKIQPGDVLVVMSAGDAIHISAEIFMDLQRKEQDHAEG
jgi:UDP-N-acetylmuramate--alanine ligase